MKNNKKNANSLNFKRVPCCINENLVLCENGRNAMNVF